jgi:hypothetical protein
MIAVMIRLPGCWEATYNPSNGDGDDYESDGRLQLWLRLPGQLRLRAPLQLPAVRAVMRCTTNRPRLRAGPNIFAT